MGTLKKLLALGLSFSCVMSGFAVIKAENAEADSAVVNETFDSTSIPENFKYIEESGTSLKAEDGKLIYERPNYINATGGFWYDLSEIGNLSEQHCNKLIFEYDVEYRDIKLQGSPSWYSKSPVILDENNKRYFDTYIESSSAKVILVSAQGYPQGAIKIKNAENDVYYKIRVTIDISNSMQEFEYAEVDAKNTEAITYTSFGEKTFYETTDGTLGKLYFAEPSNWNNITLAIDNFKITKSEPWKDMEITAVSPSNGFEFKSNKPEIVVEFSNAIDKTTISEIVLVDEDENAVATDVMVSGNKVTIVPKKYLEYSSRYFLKIGDGIKDMAGQTVLSGDIYSYSTMQDPTDRNGKIYAKDTFDDEATIENYTWTDDANTSVIIEDGVLKFNRSQAGTAGKVIRKMNIEDGEDAVVIEYDFYPINQRTDDATAWNFENPAVIDNVGKRYCSFYTQPAQAGKNEFLLVVEGGATLDNKIKFGTDYMYHIILVLDRNEGKYRAVFEENNLKDGSTRTINCPWNTFKDSNVNGTISELCFSGGHAWGFAEHNYDNFVCYTPGELAFSGANIKDGAKDIEATEEIELNFTNPIDGDCSGAIIVTDGKGKEIECEIKTSNGGKTVKLLPKNGRFEYLTDYIVTIKGEEITDIFAQSARGENTISFKTAKIPTAKIEFKNLPVLTLNDKDGNKTSDILTATKALAEVSAENISENPDSKRGVSLILVLYDNEGTLKKYTAEEKMLLKGEAKTLKAELELGEIEEGYTVKVLCWDGVPGAPYKISK